MSRSQRTMWVRIGVIVAFLGAFMAYSFWHTGKSWQFVEVDPGILYTTAVQSGEQGINACEQARCRTMLMVMSHEAAGQSPNSEVVSFGFHNKLKVVPVEVEDGQFLSKEQLNMVISTIRDPKRQPVLVVSTDGRLAGEVAAVYRMAYLKVPVEKVQKLAELPDSPPETTRAVQEFAVKYANLLAEHVKSGRRGELPSFAPAAAQEEPGPKPSATAPSLQWSEPDGR